jgi:hypothetical protein
MRYFQLRKHGLFRKRIRKGKGKGTGYKKKHPWLQLPEGRSKGTEKRVM